MTTAEQLIERIETAGGTLTVCGARIRCRLPIALSYLLDELRTRRDEVLEALRERPEIPRLPAGVHLIEWKLKEAPVPIERFEIVTDPAKFAGTTLEQLRIALEFPNRKVGWTVPQLLQRLALVGVCLVLQKGPSGENEATG